MGILTKEVKEEIKRLHGEGYFTGEIAKKLDLPEFVVIKVLKLG
jgi:hypothetical protein